MEIQIKAYAYTIDIITEIRYFCKCNNAVFGKFRIIFTCAISKTDCSLHHSFHALFKISGNEKFVRTTTLASLVKGEVLSPERIRATTGGIAAPPSLAPHHPFQKPTLSLSLFVGRGACVKSNMVYTLCKHMVYMLSITNEHKNELEMRAKPEWKVHFLCFASAKRGSFSIR